MQSGETDMLADDKERNGSSRREVQQGSEWPLFVSPCSRASPLQSGTFGRPLPPLRVTACTPITHDGGEKEVVGTDGSRVYITGMTNRTRLVRLR